MGGVYNKFEDDGLILDKQRKLHVLAVDFNTTIQKTDTYIVGEYAYVSVDVPETFTQQYGISNKGFLLILYNQFLSVKF
ncbi:MAG: hypothetical protein JKZ00_04260 [Flavobacteriaceae bacterium]|nr:hypothetical protein [Flavobacteriaceae bacterium]